MPKSEMPARNVYLYFVPSGEYKRFEVLDANPALLAGYSALADAGLLAEPTGSLTSDITSCRSDLIRQDLPSKTTACLHYGALLCAVVANC